VIYRVFVMHRYRSLLPLDGRKQEWALICLSAFTFSFMHIVFRNPVAVVLTLIGGVIFARRQMRTRSLFVSSLEHALYGCFLFTVGLGDFFYARLI
jgi:membrane protease YdiL (CAAX protease family)